jgi:uncharacterized protein YndB with AHSA1/START domain
MPFACRPVELAFVHEAPWRFESVVELAAPPERVFALFADGDSWPRWFPGMRHVEWTSPEPRGVGATRTVTLGATFDEQFLAWDPGRRFAFRFTAVSRPLLRAGVEDYRLEPLAGGRTRFTYAVGLEPSWLVWLFGFVTRPMFARTFADGAAGLQSFVAALPAAPEEAS